MAKITGGQAVVEALKAQGVNLVFGIISVHTLHLFDALYDVQTSLRHIGGRTELGCGFMADGYARSTGEPGVLLTSSGPGAANSMHSIGEAYHSGSPILQITTNIEKEFIGSRRGVIHEPKEQLRMFRSVTDWNALITSVTSIPDHIDEAFLRFKTRRPRPIELEIPTDLLGEVADVETGLPKKVQPPEGDEALVERAVNELLKAKRPLIWVGEEVTFTEGTEELITLAETLSAPVVTADGAKSLFPEDHPLSLGQVLGGHIWGRNLVHEFISTCDLVLAMGTILPYRSTVAVGLQLPEKLVHITLDGEIIGKNYPASVGIVGNACLVGQQILAMLEGKDVYKGDALKREVQQMREQVRKDLQEQWPNEVYTLEAIRGVLPRETITCWDITVPTSRASRAFPTYKPRTFMHPHGWVGIGFAFPAALGAKAGNPDIPVVCFTGDGSFQYCMSELATAAQYGLNITVVMFNDDAWGALKVRQEAMFHGRLLGSDLINPDFVKLVDSYGFQTTRISRVKELTSALERAIDHPQLSFIEVRIPRGFSELR